MRRQTRTLVTLGSLAGSVWLSACLLLTDTNLPPRPDETGDVSSDPGVVDGDDLGADLDDPVEPPDANAEDDAGGDASADAIAEPDVVDGSECGPAWPFEACGDCIDNDCDEAVDEADCRSALILSVDGQAAVDTGHAVALTFDHQGFVDAAQSRPDGQDVRVWFHSDSGWVALDRVLDPISSWAAPDTTIWFALQAQVGAGDADDRYVLELGTEDASPPADERAVFTYADLFDRPDADEPGRGWVVTPGDGDVGLAGGALVFSATGDLANRPIAQVDLPALSGPHAWRFGFNWARTGPEGTYRLHMQLGEAARMDVPAEDNAVLANAGVGPSLLWAGPNQGMTDHEGFGYEVDGAVTQVQVIGAPTDLTVLVDPESSRYSLVVDGSVAAEDIPFSQDPTALDRIRFMTWQVSDANFEQGRQFDYVIVRPLADPEPTTVATPVACP